MATKQENIKYLADPFNKKLNSLRVMQHMQLKKGNIEKAQEYEKQMDGLKLERAKQRVEDAKREVDKMEKELIQKYG